MRDEYDFSPEQLRNAARGKYAVRFCEGVNLVPIDPDLTGVFPDAEAVNQALRAMASVIRAREAADTAT
jgi:NADH:ubiquinone oxidoreductase subunit B-like Fe-S oxidoreductase